MAKTNEKKITGITELAACVNGEVIELPGWTADVPLVARLRRASLTAMITAGKIPNPLIGAAQKLYEGNRSSAKPSFEETAKVLHLVVKDAMLEPTVEQITAAGLTLTEDQVNEIYFYATGGVKGLERFRALSANRQPDRSGDAKPDEAERAAGN